MSTLRSNCCCRLMLIVWLLLLMYVTYEPDAIRQQIKWRTEHTSAASPLQSVQLTAAGHKQRRLYVNHQVGSHAHYML